MMNIENFYYLIINIFVISVPLALSFDKKVQFHKRWKQFFPSLFMVAFVFIIWDIAFTSMGVWGFNPMYLTGINIFNLPLEEVLFFITIPYACTFIYDTIKAYLPQIKFDLVGKVVYPLVALFIVFLLVKNYTKWYTATTAIATIATLLFIIIAKRPYSGRIALAYAISIVPFLLVNGVLTGSWIPEQVVWYNSNEFSDIRVGTIPLEDFFYGFSLIALNIIGYEELLRMKEK